MRVRRALPLLAGLAVLLTACGNAQAPTGAVGSSSATGSASDSASGSASGSPTQSTAGTEIQVPVYWAGDTDLGPRLYREFLPATSSPGESGPAVAALQVMFSGDALDTDYRSLWPSTLRVDSVTVDAGVATVELSGPVTDGARTASSLDIQELVHTVTAAVPSAHAVRISANGVPLVPGPVTRAPQLKVLAPVWIIDPQEGTTTGRPLQVSGAATVFEATVAWQVVSDGKVVRSGTAMASAGAPQRGTWSVTVRGLDPGTYTVRAFEVSMENGAHRFVDDKTVTLS